MFSGYSFFESKNLKIGNKLIGFKLVEVNWDRGGGPVWGGVVLEVNAPGRRVQQF